MTILSNLINSAFGRSKHSAAAGLDHVLSKLVRPCTYTLEALQSSKVVNFDKLHSPCIIHGLSSHWPAVKDQKWTIDNLKKVYGRKYFQCGSYGSESEPLVLSLREYIDRNVLRIAPPQDSFSGKPQSPNPLYLFDPTFEQDNEEMLTDYEIPSIFALYDRISNCLPDSRRPNYRWFLVGPENSGSDLHIDPLFTSAWNATTTGHKLWLIIEPIDQTQYQRVSSTFYFDRSEDVDSYGVPNDIVDDELHIQHGIESYLQWFQNKVPIIVKRMQEQQPKRRIFLFVQEPGETVYIPSQWMHAVLNLDTTVAITHNFIQPLHIDDYMREYQLTFDVSDAETKSIVEKMRNVASTRSEL